MYSFSLTRFFYFVFFDSGISFGIIIISESFFKYLSIAMLFFLSGKSFEVSFQSDFQWISLRSSHCISRNQWIIIWLQATWSHCRLIDIRLIGKKAQEASDNTTLRGFILGKCAKQFTCMIPKYKHADTVFSRALPARVCQSRTHLWVPIYVINDNTDKYKWNFWSILK